jgi:hypothetical protein
MDSYVAMSRYVASKPTARSMTSSLHVLIGISCLAVKTQALVDRL